MHREEPINRDPLDEAMAVKAKDVLMVKKRAKLYGWLTLGNFVTFALMLRGMPMHALWPVLGPVLGISLVCVSATAGRYFVGHLLNLNDARRVARREP